MSDIAAELRGLPQVDLLARSAELAEFPEAVRRLAAREAVASAREAILRGESIDVPAKAVEVAERETAPLLRPVINLSGVILHTGLGRARLAPAAVAHMLSVANGYANVEFDLVSGERGDRQSHVRDLLVALTGAEAALVVNNAAAGVVLALAALGAGREVVLSRGEMVEIGGSFRLPDIIARSGAKLVEVGCTNKTRLADYEAATGPDTAIWLRCHPSNYRVIGFTEAPTREALAASARDRGVRFIDDQGNGALIDFTRYGLPPIETLPESVRWADVAIGSGDKLLGGPQCGIVVGKLDSIRALSKHPLARAFRVDKLTLAALEATLRLYRNGEAESIPTVSYIARPLREVAELAQRIADVVPGSEVLPSTTEVGSGSAPGTGLPTFAVRLPGEPEALARSLRSGPVAVVGRIQNGSVWLDPRTLETSELPAVVAQLEAALA